MRNARSLYTRPSIASDVEIVAPLLRGADLRELKAASGRDAYTVLIGGLRFSRPGMTTCMPDGTPFMMSGVVPANEGAGAVWMLSTDAIEDYAVSFLRQCKGVLAEWNRIYPVLFNYVDARNELHVKWLKWMGFTFIKRHEHFGVEGVPFYEFVRINNNV